MALSRYLAHTGTHGKRALFALITACAVAIAAFAGGNALADGHYEPTPEGMAEARGDFIDAVDLADNDSDARDPDGTITIRGEQIANNPDDPVENLGNANAWIAWQEDRVARGMQADRNYEAAKAAQRTYLATLSACEGYYGIGCTWADVERVAAGDETVLIRASLSNYGESITLVMVQLRDALHEDHLVGPVVTLTAEDLDGNPNRYQCVEGTSVTLDNNRTVEIAVNKRANGDYVVRLMARHPVSGDCNIDVATPAANRVPTNTRDGRWLVSSPVPVSQGPATAWWME